MKLRTNVNSTSDLSQFYSSAHSCSPSLTPAQSQNHHDDQGDNGQSQNGQSGGDVVPPNVKPNGYSLDDMAQKYGAVYYQRQQSNLLP